MRMKYLLAARPYQQLLTIIAGALSILTVHSILYPILNVTLIAGARDSGLVIQMLCGALGGWAFYKQH